MTLTALAGTGDRSIGVDASGKLIEVASYGRWDNSADTVFNATPVVIDFDTASISQNISPYLTFDSVAHTWTVVVDCIIQVQTCITINTTGVLTARQTSEVGLYIDGVILPYAKAYAYHRITADGIGTVSISAIVAVSAGEVIDFRARYIDGTVALKAELNSSVSMNLLK